jgi:1-deoxyxylulose-5-phosphate synthase
MDYARLGATGLKVSRICLGCMTFGSKQWRDWMLEADDARPILRHAIDAGITHFDTADYYSVGASETLLGAALRDFGVSREKVVISTKVGVPAGGETNLGGLSRERIRASIDASLKRLNTDYVDLYQVHRFDAHTPMEEVIDALEEVVRAGKALYVGASSMHAWQFGRLHALATGRGGFRFASMQSHYNLIYREEEREMIPFCTAEGVAVLPWSPLARGLLARASDADASLRARGDGTTTRFYTHESDAAVVAALRRIAGERGVPPAQIALAWLLHQPQVPTAVIGATKVSHIDDAVASVSIRLTREELTELTGPYRAHPVVGHQA